MQSWDHELERYTVRLCLTSAHPCMWLGVRLGNVQIGLASTGRWKECARYLFQSSDCRREQCIMHRDCKPPLHELHMQ